MLDCSEFLENYSGFRDGSLDRTRLEALRAHLAACESCARYDRVVAGGVEVFRSLPAVEPSPEFLPRLHERIREIDFETTIRSRRASGASAVLTGGIAVAIAATAWAPMLRPRPAVVELPAMAAHAPHRVEPLHILLRPGPLLTGSTRIADPGRTLLFNDFSPLGSFASTPLRAP